MPLAPIAYAEWTVRPPLRRLVSCTWAAGRAGAEPVLPDGCMDLIWDGERLFVAGPDTGPVPSGHPVAAVVGVRLQPGAGPLAFGLPAVELRDARVDADCLWAEAGEVAGRLAETTSIAGARAVLEAAVTARLEAADLSPDPLVELAAGAWRADPASLPASALAREAGISSRQVHRRFVAAVGYGPKYLQRVLRLQSFLARCSEPDAGLAELAARSGFADQAHLTRETGALAGRTPAQLRATRRADVRNVQDPA